MALPEISIDSQKNHPALSGERPIRVLFVEDNEADVVLIATLLSEVGADRYEMDWVITAQDGITHLGAKEYDVCLLDIYLTEGIGLDVLKEASVHSPCVPTIILTGQGDLRIDLVTMEAGAVDYLEKGTLTPVLLERSIRYAIQRRHVENSLRLSEERFSSFMEHLPGAAWMKDLGGRYIYANHEAERIFSRTFGDLEGKTDEEVFPPKTAYQFRANDRRALREGCVTTTEVLLQADGEEHYSVVSKFPVNGLGGKPVCIGGVAFDITDRIRAEKALQANMETLRASAEELARANEELGRSNQDLEHFAYVASHDLQEPLRAIAGHLGLLKLRYRGKLGGDADEFIDFAVSGAKRMDALINGLLEYSRAGQRNNPPIPVDSTIALNHALDALGESITKNNTVVTRDKLPIVMTDEIQLSQVFQNLIGNAIKFRRREEPPRIHIGAELKGREWIFSVADNGIGIDPEYTERVFNIFEQLHPSGEYSGSGIGLAVCKRIVERFGGRIWLDSTPGKGTTFYFSLKRPLASAVVFP